MASDRLLTYSQWYEGGRKQGMGRREAMNRALAILTEDDVDALLDGRTCEGSPAKYVTVTCGKFGEVDAFQIGDMYYCSGCGSQTRKNFAG